MNTLYILIQSLTTSEYETICSYLILKTEGNKLLQLFKLLRKLKYTPGLEEISKLIYGKKEANAILKLKSRLKYKILDLLLHESNLERVSEAHKINLTPSRLKKKLASVTYLYALKGNIPIVLQLLDEINKEALEFASYSNLIESKKLERSFANLRTDESRLKVLNEEIALYRECELAVEAATDYYNSLIRKIAFAGDTPNHELQSLLNDAILDLNARYERTKAPQVQYYLKILEMAYYSNSENYPLAKETCISLFDTVEHKAIYRQERIGFIYDNIGHFDIKLHNYKNAIVNLKKAQTFLNKNSINLTHSREQEFLAAFYMNDLHNALDALDFILTHMPEDQGEFRASKFQFYKACYFFKKEKFMEAYKMLRIRLEITDDKSGWEVATRILSIMTCIELKYTDQAAMEITSLKKHLERFAKKEVITERNKLILKTLRFLQKNSFNWSLINDVSKVKSITELSLPNTTKSWRPLSTELIPFHEWFLAKLNPTVKKKVLNRIEVGKKALTLD